MIESSLHSNKETEKEERIASSARGKRWSLTVSAPDVYPAGAELGQTGRSGKKRLYGRGLERQMEGILLGSRRAALRHDLREGGRPAERPQKTSKRHVVAVWITRDGKPPVNLQGVEAGLAAQKVVRYLREHFKQIRLVQATVRLSCNNFGFRPMLGRTRSPADLLANLSVYLDPADSASTYRRLPLGAVNQCPVFMVGEEVGVALFEMFYHAQDKPQPLNEQVVADVHLFAGPFILAKSLFAFRRGLNFGRIGRSRPAAFYDKIFASYSHEDVEVVEAVASYVNAMGRGKLLWDTQILHAGEDWGERVKEEISAADIFQLFWSENARASAHVTEEWKYALGLKRDDFLKPLYWEEPLPPPPEELVRLHFSKIKLLKERKSLRNPFHPPTRKGWETL